MERTLLIMDDDFQRVLELRSVLSPERKLLHAYGFQDASRSAAKQGLSAAVLKFSTERADVCFAFLSDLRTARPMPILMTHTLTKEDRTSSCVLGADLCIDAPADVTEVVAGIGSSCFSGRNSDFLGCAVYEKEKGPK